MPALGRSGMRPRGLAWKNAVAGRRAIYFHVGRRARPMAPGAGALPGTVSRRGRLWGLCLFWLGCRQVDLRSGVYGAWRICPAAAVPALHTGIVPPPSMSWCLRERQLQLMVFPMTSGCLSLGSILKRCENSTPNP